MSKRNKNVLGTIIFIIIFNVGTKVLGIYRDALIGRSLGAELESDAYFMALGVTSLIFLSIGTGICTTMIPIITKEANKKRRQEIISSIINLTLILSLLIVVIYFLATSTIIGFVASGFSEYKFALTVKLTRILVPTIIFINLAYILTGILQSNENYILPTIISTPYNLIIIAYLFLALEQFGVVGLAVITVSGWALQFIIQLPKIIKLGEIKYSFKIDFKSKEIQLFIRGLAPIVFVKATNQLIAITDNSYIAYFGDSKITTFYNANMLFIAISTMIVYGVTTVMFPKFNKSYIENKDKFYESITNVLEGVILLLIPIGAGIAVISDELISFIFLSNKFTIESVTLTATFLKIYGTCMVAFGIMDIMNKAYYAKDNRRSPVIISLVILCSNLILNFLFTKVLMIGIYGVVIATAIAFYIGIFVSLYLFKSKDGNIKYKRIFTVFLKASISALIMFIIIYFLQIGLDNIIGIKTNMTRLLVLGIASIIGIIIYVGVLLALKEKMVSSYLKSFLEKNRR